MTYTVTNAVYALNSYLAKVLEANLGWSLTAYNGGNAFIPAAQQPEFMQLGKPFIVYGSARLPDQYLYALKGESVAYTIYASNITESDKVADLLCKAMEGWDETAARVNEHINAEAGGRATAGQNPRGVSFTSVRVTMAEKSTPSDEEGGLASSLVMAEIQYVKHDDDVKLTDFTYS
jgi:hypothetical protein